MIPPNLTPEPGFPDSLARIAAIKKAITTAEPRAPFSCHRLAARRAPVSASSRRHMSLKSNSAPRASPSAFLRAGSFMQNIAHSIPAARATGQYLCLLPASRTLYPLVATEDIGRIGAETLLETWQGSRAIEISGPVYYSSSNVATALSEALNKLITSVAVPRETWVDNLAQNGMPADRSGAYIEMLDNFNSRWIDFGVPGTEHVKGTTDLVTAVKSLVAKST